MKLISLTAKNFKKLSDFECQFQDGLNVIVGENAQGKSTLLQAIEACLFGVTVVPGKKENIPTWGQTKFSLTLTFTNHAATSPEDDWYYCLTRTGSTAKLEKIGPGEETLLANGNTPVTKFIEELLGLTAKDYNLFMQSKQGETAGVLTFGATALNQKVEEFAGVSMIDAIQRRANEISNTAKATAEALAVSDEVVDDAHTKFMELEMTQDRADQVYENAQDALAKYPALTAVEPAESSEALSRAQRVYSSHQSSLREATADLTHAEEALVSAQTALTEAGSATDVTKVEAAIKAKRAELATVNATIQEGSEALAAARSDIEALAKAKGELAAVPVPADMAALEAAVETADSSAAVLVGQIATTERSIEDLSSMAAGAECPTCKTKLTDHDPVALAAELETLKAQLASGRATLKALRTETNNASEQLRAALKVEATRTHLQEAVTALAARQPAQSDIDETAAEVATLSGAADDLRDNIAKLSAQVSAAEESNAAITRAANRLKSAEWKRAEASDALAALQAKEVRQVSDVEIDTAAQAEAAYRTELAAWNAGKVAAAHALELAKATLDGANKELESAKAQVSRLEKDVAASRVAAEESALAGRLSRFLRDRRQSYLAQVWDTVMAAASKQVKMATANLITGVAYADGEFQFEEGGVMAPVTSASGAQKAHIGTAVRIGLARALYGSDGLLILDEPTESMSERNALGLSASLVGAAKQTLLITHREQDQSLAANIIQLGA